MNKNKIVSIILSATLLVSLTGCQQPKQDTNEVVKKVEATTNLSTGEQLVKDETVYVLCNGNGSIDQVLVSDWIKNGLQEQSIKDASSLKNIEVVKGDSILQADGKQLVWTANGGDVYYQGESEDLSSLPVSMQITYTLDGKEISYEQLEGKTGHLNIRIDYQNNQKEIVRIDGQDVELYVPFIMLSGLMADSTYSNIKVSNGKLVEVEDRKVLMGFALPGLKEDLGQLGQQMDPIDYVEINADVQNVTKPVILTMASNSLFDGVDLDEVDNIDDLKAQMNQLDDGFSQLMEGTSDLYDGMTTLMQSSNTLVEAIQQLNHGATQLKNGSDALYDGAKTLTEGIKTLEDGQSQLGEGILVLSDGLYTLSANSQALNDGANQIFQAVLDTVQEKVQDGLESAGVSTQVPSLTKENYETVLTGIISAINSTDGDAYKKAREQAELQIRETVYNQENQALIASGVDDAINQGKQTAQVVCETQLQEATTKASGAVDLAFLKCALETTDLEAIQTNLPAAINEIATNQELASQIQVAIASLPEANQQALMAGLANFKQSSNYQIAVNSTVLAAVNATYGTSFTALDQAEQEILIEMGVLKTINETYNTSYTSLQEARSGLIALTSETKVAEILASDTIQQQIQAGLSEASKPISNAITQCDQIAFFTLSLNQYTNGVDTAYAGTQQLIEGSNALKMGISTLYAGGQTLTEGTVALNEGLKSLKAGTNELNEKVSALPDGVQQLTDGSMQLSDGVKKIYDEGISRILDLVNGDLNQVIDRFNAVKEMTSSYDNYSGIGQNCKGNVKFIFKVGE